MNKEIELKDIINFKNLYESNKDNLINEAKIKDLGLRKASFNNKLKDYEFKFNIEVPDCAIYNQHNSMQCNIYAFLRVVKDIMRKRGFSDIHLSANYIAFFDKLEKINTLYNELINDSNLDINSIRDKVDRYIGNYGTFHFALEIVNKYGFVPLTEMADVDEQFDGNLAIKLLRDKIKVDALTLLSLNIKDRKIKKKELMQEAYNFLAKIYGNPPLQFNFLGENLTPLQFKEKMIGNELDNFVAITTCNLDSFYESNEYIPNVYLKDNEKIIEVSLNEQRELIIRQLKDGVSVWFSCEESLTLDYDDNILDNKLYDFNKLLHIKEVSRREKLLLDIINYDHAMAITGANMENEIVTQFKIDNSFGLHGQFKGRLIMTPEFLNNYVITCIIDKRYFYDN